MKLDTLQLKNAFLAFNYRLSHVNITQRGVSHEGYEITSQRQFRGSPTLDIMMANANSTGIDPQFMQSSATYFSDFEICSFLNTAWEVLHERKTQEIASRLVGDQGVVSSVDALLKEHGDLYKVSPLIEETEPSSGISWKGGVVHERSAPNARIFIIPNQMREYGEPTILTVQIEQFQLAMAAHNYPTFSRMCRFVSSSEITTLINLASNSRYAAGALCRLRRWKDIYKDTDKKKLVDVIKETGVSAIEVFHFRDDANYEGGVFKRMTTSDSLMCVFSYIEYPAPIEVGELQADNPEGKRIIEVEYGYQIAYEAARLSSGSLGAEG